MGRTITGKSTVGVTLSSATDNPALVVRGASIDTTRPSAIYGVAGTAWTIQNDGTLNGRLSGISLASGGSIGNGTAGSIVGGLFGIAISGGLGTVSNLGLISAAGPGGVGTSLGAGGSVTNGSSADTLASITAKRGGVSIAGGLGAVLNYGTIASTGDRTTGVSLAAGGTVANGSSGDAAALILGRRYGVLVSNAAGAVTNFGTIQALYTQGTGIQLGAGGAVTNAHGALITGRMHDIVITGNGAITNYGTIGRLGNIAFFGVQISGVATIVNGSSADRSALFQTGIDLNGGGSVYNAGTIRSLLGSGTVTVTNLGKLLHTTSFDGTFDVVNGSASNHRALIADGSFVALDLFGSGTLTNLARIKSFSGSAVYATQSGGAFAILNGNQHDTAAQITSNLYDHFGINLSLSGATGTASVSIVNYGTISGFDAISLEGSAGLVASIVNAGTIIGGKNNFGAGNAILATGVSTHLTVDPGAVFVGNVSADTAGDNVLELAAGQSSGAIAGLGTQFQNFATIVVDSGANWAVTGGHNSLSNGTGVTLQGGGTLISVGKIETGTVLRLSGLGTLAAGPSGAIEIGGAGTASAGDIKVDAGATLVGAAMLAGTIVDQGLIEASTGTLTLLGAAGGAGTVAIDAASVLDASGGLTVAHVAFLAGGHETLDLAQPASLGGTISGFGQTTGNAIDLLGASATAVSYTTLSSSSGVLSVSGAGSSIAMLHFSGGNYSTSQFHFVVGAGGTNITFG